MGELAFAPFHQNMSMCLSLENPLLCTHSECSASACLIVLAPCGPWPVGVTPNQAL